MLCAIGPRDHDETDDTNEKAEIVKDECGNGENNNDKTLHIHIMIVPLF